MLSILRVVPHAILTSRLDAAVGADVSLAASRSQLLLPLQLLDALSREAEGALGGDPLAAERIRVLLSVAAPHAVSSVAATAMGDLHDIASDEGEGAPRRVRPRDVDPFYLSPVLHLGALVVVALAAGRAGAAVKMASQFVNTVHGLALAAGPAEAIAHLGAAGFGSGQLRTFLTALGAAERRSSSGGGVAAFLSEPSQRARWDCLRRLFAPIGSQVNETHWEGARADRIAAVEPLHADPGANVLLKGDFGWDTGERLKNQSLRVVFAAERDDRAVVAKKARLDLARGAIEVVVPEGARPGWVGLDDRQMRGRSNADRAKIRAFWSARNETSPNLVEAPVPVAAIRALPDPAIPPRLGTNRFRGGRPHMRHLSLEPSVVEPGGKLVLDWDVDGVDAVVLEPSGRELPAAGRMELSAPVGGLEAAWTLVAKNPCGDTRASVKSEVRATVGARTWLATQENTSEEAPWNPPR